MKPCHLCGRTHSDPTTLVRVYGSRFNVEQPFRYRARFEGAPIRNTREEARVDLCERYQQGGEAVTEEER